MSSILLGIKLIRGITRERYTQTINLCLHRLSDSRIAANATLT